MSGKTVQQLVDELVAGTVTLDEVAAEFRRRTWPAPAVPDPDEAWGAFDDPGVDPDSFAVVDRTPFLTTEQLDVLREAYLAALPAQAWYRPGR